MTGAMQALFDAAATTRGVNAACTRPRSRACDGPLWNSIMGCSSRMLAVSAGTCEMIAPLRAAGERSSALFRVCDVAKATPHPAGLTTPAGSSARTASYAGYGSRAVSGCHRACTVACTRCCSGLNTASSFIGCSPL